MTTTMTTTFCLRCGAAFYLEGCGAAELASAVPEPPAGAAPDAIQRLAAAPAFDRPPGAAQVGCGGPLRPPPCVAQRAQQTRRFGGLLLRSA